MNCAPQWGQTSFVLVPCFSCGGTRLRHRDAIALIIVFIAFLLLFIAGLLISDGCCIGGPFAFVPPDIEQLFSNRVFWGKAVLNVRLEESLIRNAALQDIGMMLLVKAHQCFRRDCV